jgi:hypothetical protein
MKPLPGNVEMGQRHTVSEVNLSAPLISLNKDVQLRI